MTYGGSTYGGTAFGSTSDKEAPSVTGTSSISVSASGTVVGSGTVSGTASVSATGTGTVVGTGQVTGSASISASANGEIGIYGQTNITATASGELTDATSAFDLGEQWRVLRDGTTVEQDLFDVESVDTANPFGNYAIAKIDDTEGDKFDLYTRGTRVDFEYSTNLGVSWTERFSGFVVEARELEDQGADTLEVEAYSFDQFLRRDTVTNDQSGNTILEALEDIIKTDTPVTWDASNVTVQDNQTLTQSLRGERVENAIQMLRAKSADEDFGVNSDIEFFFEPQETTSAPRDITDSDWFNYDLPEEGKRTINQVTVYFDDGDRSVTVDDGGDKLDLQDSLGTDDPITFAEEVTREDITNIDDARDVGEKILSDRETTLTGTVTTYGLIDASTGDVINIEIIDRGIDGDFAIAELKYLWGRGETVITVVEKRGDQDDLLVGISDTLKRTEMRPANRDATENRITNTTIRGLITVSGDVDNTDFDAWRFTNAGRNKIRDGWADNGNLDVATIAAGNDPTTPTRTDDSLGNQLASDSVTQTLPDSKTARYTTSISESDVREVGLLTNDGTLIARAVVPETSFSSPVDVTIDLTVSNDASVSRGVLTNTGQTTTRDIIADNSPALPTQYAYGTGMTAPTESDTSLESETEKISIDEVIVQTASSTEDWNNTVSFGDTDPLRVQSGDLQLLQSGFFLDPLFDFNTRQYEGPLSDSTAQGGEYIRLSENGDFVEFTFTFNYNVPAPDFSQSPSVAGIADDFRWRLETDNEAPQIEMSINNNVVRQTTPTSVSPSTWAWAVGDGSFGSGDVDPYPSIEAGETVTFRIEVTSETANQDGLEFDCVWLGDKRFSYTFDESDSDSNDTIAGPEEYPDIKELQFSTVNTRRMLQNATAEQTWNDTSNNQFIELSNDGGSTWITTNNNSTATASFASPSTQLDTKIGLSRWGTRTNTSPRNGFNGQIVSSHDLYADVDAILPSGLASVDVRAIVSPGAISTSTNLREAGQLDTNDNLLTRTTGLDVTVEDNMRIESSESVQWNNS